MKITDVEAIYVRLPEVGERCDSGQDALIVKVHTDDGLVGIGEVDSAPLAAQGMILGPYSHTTSSGFRHLLLGEDPFETERLWHKMYWNNIYAGRSGIAIHAMSGIDMALWDLKGKKLGMPVWKLLGGGYKKSIRCYASTLFPRNGTETRKLGRRLADLGFTAVKFGWGPIGQNEELDIDLVASARAGVGEKVDLMIDAGMAWDAKTAIQRSRSFSEHNIYWLEEPLSPDDYEGYRKLSEATHVRIAAGEEESSRQTYRRLMVEGKVDIVQVDLTRCGGFTEAMKIAYIAADLGLPVANHGFTTYINVAAALHWLNAIPNALIAEYVVQEGTPLRDKITHQRIRASEGYLPIPQEPGLGIDLNEEEIARYRVDTSEQRVEMPVEILPT